MIVENRRLLCTQHNVNMAGDEYSFLGGSLLAMEELHVPGGLEWTEAPPWALIRPSEYCQ